MNLIEVPDRCRPVLEAVRLPQTSVAATFARTRSPYSREVGSGPRVLQLDHPCDQRGASAQPRAARPQRAIFGINRQRPFDRVRRQGAPLFFIHSRSKALGKSKNSRCLCRCDSSSSSINSTNTRFERNHRIRQIRAGHPIHQNLNMTATRLHPVFVPLPQLQVA